MYPKDPKPYSIYLRGTIWIVKEMQAFQSVVGILIVGPICGYPEIRGTFLGIPSISRPKRTLVYWGLYWGTLILGNYHMNLMKKCLYWISSFPTDLQGFDCLRPASLHPTPQT